MVDGAATPPDASDSDSDSSEQGEESPTEEEVEKKPEVRATSSGSAAGIPSGSPQDETQAIVRRRLLELSSVPYHRITSSCPSFLLDEWESSAQPWSVLG